MDINSSIFKAYDIRGIVPNQVNSEVAYQIGYALTSVLKPKSIAVGRDMRLSSDDLFESLVRGINDGGVDAVDLGLVSTDGLYFAVGKFGFDGGVMITASHNPKEYNGFKICRGGAEPLSGQDGLNQVLKFIQDGNPMAKSPAPGVIIRKDISDDYAAHCLSFVDVTKIRPFRIVIDAGNGMAGTTLPPVLERLPVNVDRLFFDLDGSFPNHPASPIELENLRDLCHRIEEVDADFGAAFDGDADRMFLVDKNGRQVGGDMVTALVAKSLLYKHPGETILYNLICSHAVPELVGRLGGTAVRTRVGHALIKPLMKKHNAIFGGEHSGHFYFRDNWFADSGLIAFLVCLELLSTENRPLHEMTAEIDPYVRSGEINSRVHSIEEVTDRVRDAFADAEQDTIDGLTITAKDFWFNLRPSNTEPLLRLNVEAGDKATLDSRVAQLLEIIRV
ncbi:MAG: phosphomannomutase/phosphoglucomutase [candidate division Zixibacteria bacterium]|nr:phosphomannomutase/phosphoglucomutase [candidate division Zixibacteria bacterium]